MEQFDYNNSLAYQSNFENWYAMNCDERQSFNLPCYTKKEAKKVFHDIFKNKLAHSIKIITDGVLEDILVIE